MIECDIEEHIPIPTAVSKPYFSLREKAEAACNAAHLLLMHGYDTQNDPPVSDNNVNQIMITLGKNEEPPKSVVDTTLGTPEGAIRVHNVLSAYDRAVVRDALQIRTYVTNRLVMESDSLDPRIRIKALELLGKISDVGLFAERTEVTITNKSTIELENTLRDKLKKLMGVDNAEDAVITSSAVVPVRTVTLGALDAGV